MSGPVVIIPAYRQLVEGVSRFLAENGVIAVVERGSTASHVKPIPGLTNRIVFYGSKKGASGTHVNPRQVGTRDVGGTPGAPEFTVRPLSDRIRLLQVSVWARDADRPQDEGAQDDACEALICWLHDAVQSVAGGNAVFGDVEDVLTQDRTFGLERRIDLRFQHAVFGRPVEISRPAPAVLKGPQP